MNDAKQSVVCKLINNTSINDEIFRLEFVWTGTVPQAGQFFMVKPQRSGVFLARPISVAAFESNTVTFLIARRGKGTRELAAMRSGEEAELIGPLGNYWTNFLSTVENSVQKPIALIGGGIGIAPLQALLCEKTEYNFDMYAGFRTKSAIYEMTFNKSKNIIIATEDGTAGRKGFITGFLKPEQYAAVCACGPQPMLQAAAAQCKDAGVPCFISMEKRMACGVGACLGCTVKTKGGNRRCCADGPIFNAEEVIFDE